MKVDQPFHLLHLMMLEVELGEEEEEGEGEGEETRASIALFTLPPTLSNTLILFS